MAGESENIKFSKIGENEVNAKENLHFPKPILTVTAETSSTKSAIWNKDDTLETTDQVYFDGNGDYLEIEHEVIEIGNNQSIFNNYISGKCWTFNCWFRLEGNGSAGDNFILGINSSTGSNLCLFGHRNRKTYINITDSHREDGSETFLLNDWHMMTVSQRGFLEQYNPDYAYHSSNSVWAGESIGGTHGLGKLDSSQAWSSVSVSDVTTVWWQIELNGLKTVYGAITQGRSNSDQWIKTWKFEYSLDGNTWLAVDGGATFTGNTNRSTKVEQKFAKPVITKYIRFRPQSYHSHPSARMGLRIFDNNTPGYVEVYVDGEKETTVSQTSGSILSIASNAQWSIGMELDSATSTGNFINGSAKQIMIWDKPLTEDEIELLYKLGRNWGVNAKDNIIEENAVFTTDHGCNIVVGNNVINDADNWNGYAITDELSSMVGFQGSININVSYEVMIGLTVSGATEYTHNSYRWKGWKVYLNKDTSFQARYNSDGGSTTEDNNKTTLSGFDYNNDNQIVKFIINEATNYPEFYVDNVLVHTFTNREVVSTDYPLSGIVSLHSGGGFKNAKILKKVISQTPRYSETEKPFDHVFDPPYTHHSSPYIHGGESPGENRIEGKGRYSDNGAWVVWNGTTWGTNESNSSNTTHYYQIDYSADGAYKTQIAGVVTYGRYNSGQWVTKWKFQYSSDGSTWEWVDDGYEFDGNTNNDQRNMVYFASPVDTTGIRFFPTGYSSYPSARMALLLYKPNAPLYAITDNHFHVTNEGTSVELSHVNISAQIGYWGTNSGSQPTSMRVTTDSHSIDFSMHPGYTNQQGAARVRYANVGSSIMGNQYMGWTPENNKYHTYSVTMRNSGTHTFRIISIKDGTWSKDFNLSNWNSRNIEIALSRENAATDSIPMGGTAQLTYNGEHYLKGPRINFNRDNNTFVFNGSNYLRLEGLLGTTTYNNRSFVGKTKMSFSCWFYYINQGTDGDVIYSCHDVTTNKYIHKIDLDGSLHFYYGSATVWKTRTGFIDRQKWYHYAFTRNDGTFTFYINGKKVSDDDIVLHNNSSTSNPLTGQSNYVYTTSTRFSIGQEWDGGASDHWRGKIGNIYFWDRELTEDEVYSVYHNFGISKSEFKGKLLTNNTTIPETNISINSHFKDKQLFGFSLYDFSSHTFTNCGAVGRYGPTLANCTSEYSNTEWASSTEYFNNTDGIQEWTVPKSGSYKIKAYGADAVNKTGGRGAIIEGTFFLIAGEVIKILSGQRSDPYNSSNACGAGGSFVVRKPYNTNDSILVIAGGGGGGLYGGGGDDKHGQSGNNGGKASSGPDGGTAGSAGGTYWGVAGAGFFGSATAWGGMGIAPKSFIEGGVGGETTRFTNDFQAGFGGGGEHGNSHGGGGGGYSGGAGSNGYPYIGGGGGSYNSGTNQSYYVGSSHGWVGQGKVIINYISPF